MAGLLTGFLVSSTYVCIAQTTDLKVGIYNSFYNFLHNRPIPAQVFIYYSPTDSIDPLHYTYTASEFDLAEDRFYVSAGNISIEWDIPVKRRQEIRRSMWGFYDGKHVYISSRNYISLPVVLYSRILEYGRYSYFLGAGDNYKKTAGAIGSLVTTFPLATYFLLDLETGSVHKVDPLTVAKILKDFPDLYQQFEEDHK
ncbi:MAG: hypothetical protein WBA23_11885, partial [Tunicatimonas sp.]|uniref:hypothetical protein n=1 Tax=Tunicatimonas sp. TaxID=1940096 RepID=UPI003C7441EC